jgi:hypothetical protein
MRADKKEDSHREAEPIVTYEIMTYPVGDGPSVVIIGFNPSFLRFFPSDELPLAPAIKGGSVEVEDLPSTEAWTSGPGFAPGVGCCAWVPIMVIDRGNYLATSARLNSAECKCI